MPSTKTYGTPSAANKAIGGEPTIHYLDFASRGRGQVVRLLWEDAGIAYTDIRYDFDEYPEYKKTVIAEKNPTTTLPVIELNGKVLTQSYAILRHFARQLGEYDGETEEEKYLADMICDIGSDCKRVFGDVTDFGPSRHLLTSFQGALSSSMPSLVPTRMKRTPSIRRPTATAS